MSIPADTESFINRWREKRNGYDLESPEGCFDRFFTSFVLYNYLYDLINLREKFGIEKDNEKAAKIPRKFIGAQNLFEDELLRKESKELVRLIETKTFYIREAAWDAPRVEKLKSPDPEQWSKGLLEIAYNIRCNTFHGSKRFEEGQILILAPCIRAIERINDILIEKLKA